MAWPYMMHCRKRFRYPVLSRPLCAKNARILFIRMAPRAYISGSKKARPESRGPKRPTDTTCIAGLVHAVVDREISDSHLFLLDFYVAMRRSTVGLVPRWPDGPLPRAAAGSAARSVARRQAPHPGPHAPCGPQWSRLPAPPPEPPIPLSAGVCSSGLEPDRCGASTRPAL